MLRRFLWAPILFTIALAVGAFLWWSFEPEQPALSPGWTATVGVIGESVTFADPYGVAVAADGTIYVADGANGNRIHAITPHGFSAVIAGDADGFADGVGPAARFSTPSGLAIDAAGMVYVADTGNNAVRRIAPDGRVTTVTTALNGPMGIAVDPSGRLLVADTYHDRIAVVDTNGVVTPLPVDAPLNTPTAVAVGGDGTIYVADTGNNVVRAIGPGGAVTTFDASEAGGLQRPLGITVDSAGTLYVSDDAGRIIEIAASPSGTTARILAGSSAGYRNGPGQEAQFRRPAGIIALERGRLVVADSGNGLLRTLTATALAAARPPASPRIAPEFDVDAFAQTPLLWPLEPLAGPFEIAGTIGEARGQDAGRFHAGIDVRAENGDPVLAVRPGVVTSPLATGDFGTLNEWLRLGDLTYVHLRVGRTLGGDVTDPVRFVATRDERGRMIGVRAKRGARFHTGDVIGSVNRFNHVHLNVGWGGEEYNPLLFRLVQFTDTVPPTIASGGIQLLDAHGTPVTGRVNGRLVVSGPIQVVVDAWDQADGNRPNRRLGVYSLGYQVLHPDGTPVAGFESPVETIRFDRLIDHPDATRLVYAPGSGIPFYGQRRTRFLYIVTNRFRDGVARRGVWDTSTLPPGDYTLRVRVADVAGNEAQQRRDVPVTVSGRALPVSR